ASEGGQPSLASLKLHFDSKPANFIDLPGSLAACPAAEQSAAAQQPMPAVSRRFAAAFLRHRDANRLGVRNHYAVPFLHIDRFLHGFTDGSLVRAAALHG